MQLNAQIDAAATQAFLSRLSQQIPTAEKNALAASIDRVHSESLKAFAVGGQPAPAHVVANRVIKQVNQLDGSVWVGQMPVNATFLGEIRQGGTGAYAGGKFYNHAFIVEKNGMVALFRRTGKRRYPIKPVREEVTPQSADALANLGVNEYIDRFFKPLNL